MLVRLHSSESELSEQELRARRPTSSTLEGSQRGQINAHSEVCSLGMGCYVALPDKYRALELERYLKSHSGRAFAKKRWFEYF